VIASRRGFLTGLTSLFAAPAIVRADSLMKLHQIPERWATVWGVGWDFEVVEVPLWKPISVAQFGGSECVGGHIDKFREVTEWVYTKPEASMAPILHRSNPARDWFAKERRAIVDDATGFTNVAGYHALKDWQKEQMTVRSEWAEAGIWV